MPDHVDDDVNALSCVRTWRRRYHILHLVGLSLALYANSLGCGFVFDDISAIVDNKDLRSHVPLKNLFANDFWGTPMSREHSHKSYRPLCVLTFRLNFWIHELRPWGYHLTNVLLHALVSVLYYKTCLAFVPSRKVAQLCSLLFVAHPIHTEAVTGIVGRAELLSSVFFLLSILSYEKAAVKGQLVVYLPLSMAFVGCAMLCKEQGITVLGILVVYEIFLIQKLDWKNHNFNWPGVWSCLFRLTTVILTGTLLLLLRFLVMAHNLPVFTNFDNPASYTDPPTKQLTWAYLLAVNAWLLLAPAQLLCDWTMGTVPLVVSLADPRNLATLVLLVILAHLAYVALSKINRALLMSLAMMGIPFLPASNLFFPVGFVVAERILYIPSMGFCLLVSIGYYSWRRQLTRSCSRLQSSGSWNRQIICAMMVSVLALDSLKCFLRNKDWNTEESIFLSGLKVSRTNAKLWNNVGHALESKQSHDQALKFFQQATMAQADDIGAYINVGRTLNQLGRYDEAEKAYLKAKSLLPQPKAGQRYVTRIAPQHLSVFLNLGNLMAKDKNRLEEADNLYKQAISMRNDYVQAYINRGDVLIKMGKTNEAFDVYQKALVFEPDNPDLHYNLGVVLIELGEPKKALEMFNAALTLDPEHLQSLMNSAILMQESGQPNFRPEAYQRLYTVMERQPENDRIYFNLGMLSMDDGEALQAEAWFKKAVELRPDFRSALFNLALLLNEQKRPKESLPFLHQLMEFYPDHIKGLILLGDIYTNHLHNLEQAEETYRRILKIDQGHVQGHHNLCVVMVEKGDLIAAHECLQNVLAKAPEESYIKKHLSIVQSRLQAAIKQT